MRAVGCFLRGKMDGCATASQKIQYKNTGFCCILLGIPWRVEAGIKPRAQCHRPHHLPCLQERETTLQPHERADMQGVFPCSGAKLGSRQNAGNQSQTSWCAARAARRRSLGQSADERICLECERERDQANRDRRAQEPARIILCRVCWNVAKEWNKRRRENICRPLRP